MNSNTIVDEERAEKPATQHRAEDTLDTLRQWSRACRDTQQRFLGGGKLSGMEENMMLPDAKMDAYIEVGNHLILRIGSSMSDEQILQSALNLVENELNQTPAGVYEKYRAVGYTECRHLLLELIKGNA